MSLSEIQSRELCLEIWNVETAPEKSHKQVGPVEFIVQAILRQSFPAHKTRHATVAIESDHGDVSIAGRHASCFNVQVEDTMTERVKQTPVFARLETSGEVLCVPCMQMRLGGSKL